MKKYVEKLNSLVRLQKIADRNPNSRISRKLVSRLEEILSKSDKIIRSLEEADRLLVQKCSEAIIKLLSTHGDPMEVNVNEILDRIKEKNDRLDMCFKYGSNDTYTEPDISEIEILLDKSRMILELDKKSEEDKTEEERKKITRLSLARGKLVEESETLKIYYGKIKELKAKSERKGWR